MSTWFTVGSSTAKTAAGEDWFHGSGAEQPFERFELDKNRQFADTTRPKHWNTHLGVHFTSEHKTAAELASQGLGHVYHAELAMSHPKHYDSEFDLDREAHAFAHEHFDDISHPDEIGMMRPEQSEAELTNHPEARQIARRFQGHLKRQGYDGVTYGNEYEGGHRHECAIAFHPEDITITDRHHPDEACEHGSICPECQAPLERQHHGECDNCGEFVDWHDQHHVASAQTWYHGSPSPEPIERFERRVKQQVGPRDWNTRLGSHWTSLHQVADNFAEDGGSIHHAHLAMANPKHYPDEWDLDHEAHGWARAQGFTGLEGNPEGPGAMLALREHPQGDAIADGFKAHLASQGHDGITYGNHYEEPEGHLCAIAFHPDDVTVTGHHPFGQPCTTKQSRLTEYPRPEEHGFYEYPQAEVPQGRPARPGLGEPGGGRPGAQALAGHRPADQGRGLGQGVGRDGATGSLTWKRVRIPLTSLVTDHRAMQEVLDSGRVSDTPNAPIEVCRREDMPGKFEISDGHHRVADAIRREQTHVDATVFDGEDDEPYGGPFYDFSKHMGHKSAAQDAAGSVTWHPAAAKDMKRLDGPVRKQMQGTIDKIVAGDPATMAQTHALAGPMKGWNATKASRGHRVIHQPNEDGGIHIGYVGLHEYGKAIQRLTSKNAGGYQPGEWDRSGDWPQWTQDHASLVEDALHSWVGSPTDMQREIKAHAAGEPLPVGTNGTARINRAQAQALHREITEGGQPNPKRLYRGTHEGADLHPDVPTSWSEKRSQAETWARKGGGQVHVLEPGQGHGIRMADHTRSGLDEIEKQWLVVAPRQRQAQASFKVAVEQSRLWPQHPLFRPGDRVLETTPNGNQYPATVHHQEESTDPDSPGTAWITEERRGDLGEVGVHPSRLSPHPDAPVEQHEYYQRQKARNEAGEPYVPQAERDIDPTDRVTVHHLTSQHDFAPDPHHRPENNTTIGGSLSPRLFVGSPSAWAEGEHHYRRPYVAEMTVPRGAVQYKGGYLGEGQIPGRHFDKVEVTRVIPYSEHRREQGEPGYRSPTDTRTWTEQQHRDLLKTHREHLHTEHGWGWNEFDRNHNHVGLGDDDWDEQAVEPGSSYPGTYVRRDKKGRPMTQVRSSKTAGDEEPFLHSSNTLFEPGHRIHPANQVPGVRSPYGSGNNAHYSDGHVYLYKASEVPKDFRLQGGAVYEVYPHGEVEPDPEPWRGKSGTPGCYRTEGPVTVKRLVRNDWRDPRESIPAGLRGSGWTPSEQPRAKNQTQASLSEDDTADRDQVYAAERALPPRHRQVALTDERVKDLAAQHLGERVDLVRTNHLGDSSLHGMWFDSPTLGRTPIMVAPHDYPLSHHEVCHEVAHLLADRDGPTGHGAAFREHYLRILPADVRQHMERHWAKTASASEPVTLSRGLPETRLGPLYHGTTAERAGHILAGGFEGDRVHLTSDPDLAYSYAQAKAGKEGGQAAVLRVDSVHGVSGHEVGFLDPDKARAAGAHYQDKGPEVVVLDPSRLRGVTRHAARMEEVATE